MVRGVCRKSIAIVVCAAVALSAFYSKSQARVQTGTVIRVSSISPYRACKNGPTTDANYLNAEVEPSLASDPRSSTVGAGTLVGVWQQDRWSSGGAHGLVAAIDSHSGKRWTLVPLPLTRCAPGGLPYDVASDPWVSIGPDGAVYVTGLVLNTFGSKSRQAIAAMVSVTSGRTWKRPVLVVSDGKCCMVSDKETITADPTQPGEAYIVWSRDMGSRQEGVSPAWFSRTSDWGRSWSTPRRIVPPNLETVGNQIIVQAGTGRLYNVFSLVNVPPVVRASLAHGRVPGPESSAYIAFITSSDRGEHWSPVHLVSSQLSSGVDDAVGAEIRTGQYLPVPAADSHGNRLYVAWQDARFSGRKHDDIVIARSDDGGLHWNGPWRVNRRGKHGAFTPSIAVASDGTVGIAYYDFRHFAALPPVLSVDYWLACSHDFGRTFAREIHLRGPFDFLRAPWARGFFVGDYQGLVTQGTRFDSLFTATNSQQKHNPTDIFASTVQSCNGALIPRRGGTKRAVDTRKVTGRSTKEIQRQERSIALP